jgi:hypothetical protein
MMIVVMLWIFVVVDVYEHSVADVEMWCTFSIRCEHCMWPVFTA